MGEPGSSWGQFYGQMETLSVTVVFRVSMQI